ncbi:MAG: RNA methyltransferase substrate-binding domain-containing protein, partial [candidate division NC10 bacterium]|nr:RNA methyltransferase substrate-binding domain-containing protein [candidate division NC10 bacterium]
MDEILLGPHSILEGLRAGKRNLKRLYIAKGRSGEKIRTIVQLARERGVPVSRVERSRLSSLSGNDRHQGAVALAEGRRYFTLEEILEE